jgi:hypothetical protein
VISDEIVTQTNEDAGLGTLMSATTPGRRKNRNAIEESVSAEQIEKYQEQIIDLEARCTARQEQIEEVSFIHRHEDRLITLSSSW